MISNQSLTCPKGASLTFEIDMDTGSDLTGATAQWALCESWFDQAKVYLTKTGTGDGLFIGEDNGVWKITVNLAPTDTLDIPSGLLYHDCKVLLQSGDVEDVANGPFSLDPSVNILLTNAPITRNLHAVQLLGRLGQNAPLIVAWLPRNLLAAQSLVSLGQSAAGTVTSGGVSPAFQADLLSSTSLPSWLSLSRAGNGMVTDSTGKLTYAPNNILTNSNDLTAAEWNKTGITVTTGIADPFGGTAASTITATGAAAEIYQRLSSQPLGVNWVSTFWARRRAGSGAVDFYKPNDILGSVSLTGSWQQFSLTSPTTNTGQALFDIVINTSGDAIDIYAPTLSQVTYETSPRTADQVITTDSPYYGPRSDFAWNGSAWVAVGLLDEEQRTNLAKPSVPNTSAGWQINNVAVTNAAATAPDGTTTAIKIAPTGTSVPVLYDPFNSVGVNTFSVFAKVGEYTKASVRLDGTGFGSHFAIFDLSAKTVLSSEAGMTSSIKDVGNGWLRLISTLDAGGTAVDIYSQFGPVDDGYSVGGGMLTLGSFDNTKGVYFWGAQLEVGPFATSYIPTTTAAVTRSADITQLTGAALAAVQGAAFSIVIEAQGLSSAESYSYLLAAETGAAFIGQNGNSLTDVYTDNVAGGIVASLGSGTMAGIFRAGASQDASNFSLVANGGTVVTGTPLGHYPVGVGTKLNGSDNINAWIRSIAIYSSRLSDADLQAKSVVGASF